MNTFPCFFPYAIKQQTISVLYVINVLTSASARMSCSCKGTGTSTQPLITSWYLYGGNGSSNAPPFSNLLARNEMFITHCTWPGGADPPSCMPLRQVQCVASPGVRSKRTVQMLAIYSSPCGVPFWWDSRVNMASLSFQHSSYQCPVSTGWWFTKCSRH